MQNASSQSDFDLMKPGNWLARRLRWLKHQEDRDVRISCFNFR